MFKFTVNVYEDTKFILQLQMKTEIPLESPPAYSESVSSLSWIMITPNIRVSQALGLVKGKKEGENWDSRDFF